ncbi:MAG: LLM class flavin-dependent oxidoreductase [Nitrososphaerales archaeon]
MNRTEFGVVLGSKALPQIVKHAARICDDSTMNSFWVPETTEYGGFSMLGYLASHTKRILLGSGIVNVYSRQPKTIRMEAKSLFELSNGRFILGIGASAPPIIEQWHGIKFARPIQVMIQATQTLREAYNGLIYWAAVNKVMTKSAGKFADGVIFFLKPVNVVRQYAEYLKEGASQSANYRAKIVSFVPTYISNDKVKAMNMARTTIAAYVGGSPFYGQPIIEAGFAESVNKIRNAWVSGDRTLAIRSVPDELVSSIAAVGTVDDCINILQGHASAGICTVVAAFDLRRHLYDEQLLNNLRKFVNKL